MSSSDSNKRSAASGAGDGTNKSQKTHTCSSPSASAHPEKGFSSFMQKVRSPLRFPLSLPLIQLLDDDNASDNTALPEPLQNLYNQDKRMLCRIRKESSEVCRKALEEWDSTSETDFTDTILTPKLEQFWTTTFSKAKEDTGESQGSATSEISVPIKATAQPHVTGYNHNLDGGETRGLTDILFSERSRGSESEGHPICLMEIGLKNKYGFWEKLSQGEDYVAMMRSPTNNGGKKHNGIGLYRFDKAHPMLLSSIIIGKEKGVVSGDFGIVLCVPTTSDYEGKKQDDFRYILLWRKRIQKDLTGVVQAFGKVIQASYALFKWRKHDVGGLNFEYLGPDCARFGDRLYRSYDTRFRGTDRSPDLYLWVSKTADGSKNNDSGEEKKENDPPKLGAGFHWYPEDGDASKAPQEEVAKVVLDMRDGNDVLGFGEPVTIKRSKWLWTNRGRLLIISVPYRHGVHVATKVSDFVPIFRHLIHLHQHNIVHGDIRAFNMVFQEDPVSDGGKKGWLIDLDFGGEAGDTQYPSGYKGSDGLLADGCRLGKQHETIKKRHDYYALWKVIQGVHEVNWKGISDGQLGQLGGAVRAAHEGSEQCSKSYDNEEAILPDIQDKLDKFLKNFGETRLICDDKFWGVVKKLVTPKDNKTKNGQTPEKNGETSKQVATGSYHAK